MNTKLIAITALVGASAAAMADSYAFGFSGADASLVVHFAVGGDVTLTTGGQQGWWSDTYVNADGNTNYFAGNTVGSNLRNFFSFDTSSLSNASAITGADLVVNGATISDSGFYYLFDVETDAATLNLTDGTNAAIFADLGSGESYGGYWLNSSLSDTLISFTLDSDGVTDLTAAKAGAAVFSIGGKYNEVESVPEPASMAVLGLGAAAFLRRRRAQKA